MNENANRIEHFKKMAEADPTNELGHFSLGRALLETGEHAQAIASFDRTLALNDKLSKAYQLKAQALLALDRRADAIAVLKQGIAVAVARGDMMPRNEMAQQLKELGVETAQEAAGTVAQAVGADQVLCRRCGKANPRLARPPFNNALGREIQEKICQDCWKQWIGMGTKVINELRLPLSDPSAQKVYDQHMIEFLNLH